MSSNRSNTTSSTTQKTEPKKAEYKSTLTSRESDAGKRILKFWHTYKLAKQILNDGYPAYLSLLQSSEIKQDQREQKSDTNTLAAIMFGKTIAPVNPQDANMFPFINPYEKNMGYHRTAKVSNIEIAKNLLASSVKKPNFNKYRYIPISLLHTTPIEAVMETYFDQNMKDHISVIKQKGEATGFLRVERTSKTKHNDMQFIFSTSGLIISPWQLAIAATKAKLITHKEISDSDLNIKIPYLSDIKKLKLSNEMAALKSIANHNENPTYFLAKSLYQLILALPEKDINPGIVSRIHLFLSMAVMLYKKDYERFSLFVYTIVHEISLIGYEEIAKGRNLLTFEQFKHESIARINDIFDIDESRSTESKEEEKNFTFLAAPAMSGSHAYVMALELAKKMTSCNNPVISVEGRQYFEFDWLHDKTRSTPNADIYIFSSGAMVFDDMMHHGININKIIRAILKQRNNILSKPITLIVDTTTALYKNLSIDNDLKKFIIEGDISILFCESHQKLHLLHTDQAQYGRVFGMLSNKTYSAHMINQFEKAAKQDFDTQLDMNIGAYINYHCSEMLEIIKQKHFENDEIIRHQVPIDYQLKESKEDNRIDGSIVGFTTCSGENKHSKAAPRIFRKRDSFGHFTTTYSLFKNTTRISANASDEIDTKISANAFYLLSNNLNIEKVIACFNKFLINMNKNKISINDEIELVSALLAFNNNSNKTSHLILLACALKSIISYASKELTGRNAYNYMILLYRDTGVTQEISNNDNPEITVKDIILLLDSIKSKKDHVNLCAYLFNHYVVKYNNESHKELFSHISHILALSKQEHYSTHFKNLYHLYTMGILSLYRHFEDKALSQEGKVSADAYELFTDIANKLMILRSKKLLTQEKYNIALKYIDNNNLSIESIKKRYSSLYIMDELETHLIYSSMTFTLDKSDLSNEFELIGILLAIKSNDLAVISNKNLSVIAYILKNHVLAQKNDHIHNKYYIELEELYKYASTHRNDEHGSHRTVLDEHINTHKLNRHSLFTDRGKNMSHNSSEHPQEMEMKNLSNILCARKR